MDSPKSPRRGTRGDLQPIINAWSDERFVRKRKKGKKTSLYHPGLKI